MINVSENIKTGSLTITVNASEPRLASKVNESLIKQLDSYQREHFKAKTGKTKIFIQERIFSIKKELIESEETLKVFRDRNRRIENSPALQLEQQRLVREVSVLTSVFTTLKQQLETSKIEEVKESDYVIVLDPPEVPLNRSKPNKKLMVIIAGISGIILGLVLALLSDSISKIDKIEKGKIKEAQRLIMIYLSRFIPNKFS